MVKDSRGKTFSCLKCGTVFTAYPPDDFHQIASIKADQIEDPVRVEYRCKEEGCGNVNILYWGWQKIDVSVG